MPAVSDDGSAVMEDAPLRAAPRLWSPADPAADAEEPPPAGKSREKSKRKPAPPPEPRERYSPTIKETPADERPRERLSAYGVQALTTAELLAILIRTGSRERNAVSLGEFLLAEFGSIKGVATATVEQLAKVKGLGAVKAGQIKAAIEFGNRLSLFTEDAKPSIGGPRDVANLLMPDLRYQKKEILKSLLLDTKNRVLAIRTVSIGDLSSSIVHPREVFKDASSPTRASRAGTPSIVHPREVFKDAVVISAAALIVAHNHPSGDPAPSAEDVAVTKRLIGAGEIMGIDLLDHIVIGDGVFVSLKERGLI